MPLLNHRFSWELAASALAQSGSAEAGAGQGIGSGAWARKSLKLAVLSLVVFYALALASWLATGTVVPWDSKNHFYAMFRFLGDSLQNGEIPLWNPYHFGGHPAAADPQSLLFTPTMMVFALIAPRASMQVFDAVILAHLLAGGFCILGLFRRWRWHPSGAVLAAILFMLGGAASSRLQHTGIIISYSFFPAALWSLDVMLERRSACSALVFGLCASLMVLGRDQVAFLLSLTLIAYLVFAAAQSGSALAFLRQRAGVVARAALIIIAVMGVPILLTMQFIAESNRPGFPFGVAAAGSLAPVNLITLFVPNFFGSLDRLYDYWGPDNQTMPLADYTDRAIDYLFIGTMPSLLVAWHGLAAGRLFAGRARFFVGLFLLALLYALGRYTPFFAFVFDWIPGVSLYRRPADATFAVNAALAFGCGYLLHSYVNEGLHRSLGSRPRPLALFRAAAVCAALAAVAAAALAFSFREGRLFSSAAGLSACALLAGAGAGLFTIFRGGQRRALAASLFVLVSGAELLWRNAASPLNAEPASRYSVYAGLPQPEAAGIALLRKEIAAGTNDNVRPRVEILGLKGPWQNASMVLKLENTLGYNPLRIEDYERAVGTGQDAEELAYRRYPGTFRGYNSRLASLLGLEYLILDRPLDALPAGVPRPKAELIYTAGSMHIYRLGKIAPRAYLASILRPVDGEDVLDEQAIPGFDPSREVLIDEASMPNVRHGPYAAPANLAAIQTASLGRVEGLLARGAEPRDAPRLQPHVAIVRYTNNSVELEVDAPKPAIAVLHDLFYPGWVAFVDGRAEPVLRANILFRGVEVPAGHHLVSFCYRPFSLSNLVAAAQSALHRSKE